MRQIDSSSIRAADPVVFSISERRWLPRTGVIAQMRASALHRACETYSARPERQGSRRDNRPLRWSSERRGQMVMKEGGRRCA